MASALIRSTTLTFWRAQGSCVLGQARLWAVAADRTAAAGVRLLSVLTHPSRSAFTYPVAAARKLSPRFPQCRSPAARLWTNETLLVASKEPSAASAAAASGTGAQQQPPPPRASGEGPDKESKEGLESQETSKKLSLFQRFKNAYKEYGKVLIAVHVATSAVWFSSFYYLARSGVDIAPMLQTIGFSDAIISKVTDSAAGDLAVAYVLYEITKPVRFAVTLVGTQHTVRKLRQWGYMELRKDEDRLTVLAREGRQQFKDKRVAITEKVRQRVAGRLVFRRRGAVGRSGRLPGSSSFGKDASPSGSPSGGGGSDAATSKQTR